jgi:hypothetical protein
LCQRDYFPAEPQRGPRPVVPPAVGSCAHYIGDIDHDDGRGISDGVTTSRSEDLVDLLPHVS